MFDGLVNREQPGVDAPQLDQVEVGDQAAVVERGVVAHHQSGVRGVADVELQPVDAGGHGLVEVSSCRGAALSLDRQACVSDHLHGIVAVVAGKNRHAPGHRRSLQRSGGGLTTPAA